MASNPELDPSETPRVSVDSDMSAELAALEAKVGALLPPEYQKCFEAVNPRSMGSAGLKYGPDERVAWDQIWTHFCDLAMAGGPPHRGTLLEAPTVEEVDAEPAGAHLVGEEIARGIRLTTGLLAERGPKPGWVTVPCDSCEMSAWLLRAVMAENVFIRRNEDKIQVPAGPDFRIVKEVKNVVVSLAKTYHYWKSHLLTEQKTAVANLFGDASTTELLEPPSRPEVLAHAAEYRDVTERAEQAVAQAAGLPIVRGKSQGWIGVKLSDERTAAWFVRSAIAENILARREEDVLFLPVPIPHAGLEVVERVSRLHRLWSIRR